MTSTTSTFYWNHQQMNFSHSNCILAAHNVANSNSQIPQSANEINKHVSKFYIVGWVWINMNYYLWRRLSRRSILFDIEFFFMSAELLFFIKCLFSNDQNTSRNISYQFNYYLFMTMSATDELSSLHFFSSKNNLFTHQTHDLMMIAITFGNTCFTCSNNSAPHF